MNRTMRAAIAATAMVMVGAVAEARHVKVAYVDANRPAEFDQANVIAAIQRVMREWEAHNTHSGIVFQWGGVIPLSEAPEDFNNIVIRWVNTDYSSFRGISCNYYVGCVGSPPVASNHILLASYWDMPTPPRSRRWNNPLWTSGMGTNEDLVTVLMHEMAHLLKIRVTAPRTLRRSCAPRRTSPLVTFGTPTSVESTTPVTTGTRRFSSISRSTPPLAEHRGSARFNLRTGSVLPPRSRSGTTSAIRANTSSRTGRPPRRVRPAPRTRYSCDSRTATPTMSTGSFKAPSTGLPWEGRSIVLASRRPRQGRTTTWFGLLRRNFLAAGGRFCRLNLTMAALSLGVSPKPFLAPSHVPASVARSIVRLNS